MKPKTKELLYSFIDGIPALKRTFDLDLSNPNDEKRLIMIAVSLLENNDSIEIDDIRLACEKIGGMEYNVLLSDRESFEESFSTPIFERIDDVKNIIDVYRNLRISKN
ncbi:MAG: hypothetical protein AB7S72_18200 [Draconibacterium sp.]